MFRHTDQRGVNLLELMVALSIVIILTLISIPSLSNLIKIHRITATSESLYYQLQYARSEAIKRNANVYVSFTTGDNWCYGINVGSACTCTTPSGCNLGTGTPTAAQLISLSASGYPANSFYFEGTHGAASSSGSLTLTLYQGTSLIQISIGLLGNLQMCSTGISGYTAC